MNGHKVPHRRYTLEFRGEATRLANSVGHNEAARRLGVPVSTIGNGSRRSCGTVERPSRGQRRVRGNAPKPSVTELETEVSRTG
jgi:transposase